MKSGEHLNEVYEENKESSSSVFRTDSSMHDYKDESGRI